MYLFFDESGDYGFPEDRFDCYVQAALISPDRSLPAIDDFVRGRKQAWDVDELHAVDLEPAQVLAVAEFIGQSDCQLLAHATDAVLVTRADIAHFRLDQAARLERNLNWYRRESTKAIGTPVQEIEEWYLRHIKRAGLESQISHGEFQAHYLVELIADALQKALLVYHEDRWRADFQDFRFILDGKLPQKMAAGEKYLNDSIVPVLGSRPQRGLSVLDAWKHDPPHPFVEKFEVEHGRIRGQDVEGAFDLKLLFEHGLRFEPSDSHGGLQLVDAVAHIVRRAVLEPDDGLIQTAYDAFRDKLRNEEGNCLTIHRLRVGNEDRSSLDHYRDVYGRRRGGRH
jgi:hypothetical protein